MALGLAGDDHRVEREEVLDERVVGRGDGAPGLVLHHLGAEDRVVLGQGVPSLDLHPRRRLTGDRVEEDGLLHGRHHRVADSAHHRVVGPHDERVLAALGQAARVVPAPGLDVEALPRRHGRGQGRVDAPAPVLDVGEGDHGVRRRVRTVGAHPEERVEDLRGGVRVEGHHDLRDAVEVAVEESRDPLAVLGRSTARAAAHEQLELGEAERVLHVDQERAPCAGCLPRPGGCRAWPPRPAPRPRAAGRPRGRRGSRPRGRRTGAAGGSSPSRQTTRGWMTRPEGSLGWKNVLLAGIDSPASATSTIWRTGVARNSTARRQAPFASASSASACECT